MIRRVIVLFGIFAVFGVFAQFAGTAAAHAEATSATQSDKISDFVKLLDDPEVRAWLNTAPRAGGTAADQTLPGAGELASWDVALRQHISDMGQALRNLPSDASEAYDRLVHEGDAGIGAVLLLGVVLIAAGLAAEFATRQLVRGRLGQVDPDKPERIPAAILPLVAFAVAGLLAFLAVGGTPLARRVILVYFVALVFIRLVSAVSLVCARMITRANQTAAEIKEISFLPESVQSYFWPRRITIFAAYLSAAWATLGLLPALGFSSAAGQLLAYIFGLGLLALAIESVWQGEVEADPNGLQRKLLQTLFVVLLWVVWSLGLNIVFWLGVYVLVLPKALKLSGSLATSVISQHSPDPSAFPIRRVIIERGARALIVLAAVLWIALVLRINPGTLAGEDSVGSRLARSAMQATITLLTADLLWQIAKIYIDQTMSASGTETSGRSGRLRTLLPIFRNAIAVLVVVVAGLMVLSEFGVQVGPLIAGASIFGVAIGFGSQTLVKDIVSGIFYLADDAFRVGEYIQSGSYKGTVEGFSLRSVRLRHHRGPVYTVPFGQLGAVQNMSRDWVIDKFVVRFPFDSDIKQIKKLTKAIGASLLEDEELGPIIMQTMKMKGVEQIGDYGIDVSFGFMTKPGYQTSVRRRAYNLMRDSFAANGIEFARPSVEVGGGDSQPSTGAAAQMLKAKAEEALAAKA